MCLFSFFFPLALCLVSLKLPPGALYIASLAPLFSPLYLAHTTPYSSSSTILKMSTARASKKISSPSKKAPLSVVKREKLDLDLEALITDQLSAALAP